MKTFSAMKINLIAVPYHLGRENTGMEKGPFHCIKAGVDRILIEEGHEVEIKNIKIQHEFKDEISAVVEINQNLREAVEKSISKACCQNLKC